MGYTRVTKREIIARDLRVGDIILTATGQSFPLDWVWRGEATVTGLFFDGEYDMGYMYFLTDQIKVLRKVMK